MMISNYFTPYCGNFVEFFPKTPLKLLPFLFIVKMQKFTENKISNYYSIYNMSGVFSLGLSLIRFNISLNRFETCWNNLGILVFNFYRCGHMRVNSTTIAPLSDVNVALKWKWIVDLLHPLVHFVMANLWFLIMRIQEKSQVFLE